MLHVAGKPMLEHIILHAKADGFNQFVFAVHYLGHVIEEYFGNGDRWRVTINYLKENIPLGTAGALNLLAPRPDTPFLVSNGDVLTDISYSALLDFHCQHHAQATMAVRLHEWQNPFGVVQIKGVDIVGFEEKPVTRSHINAGVYVLEPNTLGMLNTGEHCDMPELFRRIKVNNLKTIAYPMHEPWLDVGRIGDLEQANIVKSASENGSRHDETKTYPECGGL
jgi:NDP-sugar pyrophosphorylase family protein